MASRRPPNPNIHRLSDPVPYEFDPPPPPEVLSSDPKTEWKGAPESAYIPRHHQTYPAPRHASGSRTVEPVSPTLAAWNRRNTRAGHGSRAATSVGPSRAAAPAAVEERDPRTRVPAAANTYRDPRALEEDTDSTMTSSEAETDGTSAPSSETGEDYEVPSVTQPPSRRPTGATLGRAATVAGWEREPEIAEVTPSRKLGRYHTVLGEGLEDQRHHEQSHRTYASDSYAPTSMASRRHAAEPPLAGGFSTPARANVVRKDSLRSTSSPSTLRMDRATLTALGLSMPKAPMMGKYDTPVCEYDGTPLGVGLGGLGGLSHGLALGRKNSLNRIIMDEGLAKQLEVEKLSSSTSYPPAASNSSGVFGFGSTPGQYALGATTSGTSWGRRQGSSRLQQHFEPASSITTLEDVEMEDVEAEQMQDSATSSAAAAMASSSAGLRRQNTSASVLAKSPSWQEAQELRRKQQQAEKEAAAAAAEQEREKRKKAAEEEAEKQRLEEEAQQAARDARPKFVPTPSNRRMGFEVEPAQEVVPGDVGSESDTLLGICVLAVESIWPQHRPSGWSYEVKSTSAARGVLPLSTFVKEVLRRSRTLPNTLHIALYYLHQSRRSIRERVALSESAKKSYRDLLAKNAVNSTSTKSTPSSSSDPRDGPSSPESSPKQPEIDRILQAMSDPVLCGRRMFLASLMCASKYLQDRNFSNRAWAKISGLPVKEVNSNERVFLNLIKYKLHIEASIFQKWTVRLAKLAEEKGKGAPALAPKIATDSSSRPSEPSQAAAPVAPKRPVAPVAVPPEASTSLPSLGERLVQQYRSTGNPAAATISRSATSTPVLTRAATLSGSVPASKAQVSSLSRQASYLEPGARSELAPATVDRYAEQTRRRRVQEEAERHVVAAAAVQSEREKQRNRALASARAEAQVVAAQAQAQAHAASQHVVTRERELARERERERERERASRETYAIPEYRRNRTYPAAAPAPTIEVEDPHMDLDLSALRERPPSSCGMQDGTSADFGALSGHHPHHAAGYGSYYAQGRAEPEHHFRHGYRSFAAAHIY